MNSSEELVHRYEEGDTWREDDEVVQIAPPRKRPVDKVIPVRLSAADWENLRSIAAERGVGPSTLLRHLALKGIQEELVDVIGKSMALERGQQYDRRQLMNDSNVVWVDFVEERTMPEVTEREPRGSVTPRGSSQLKHIFRAIVRDRDNRELFTVEYVAYGSGKKFPPDPRRRDMPLRREVTRRLLHGEWEPGEVYEVAAGQGA